jgi:hypothetical protein
MNFCLLEFDCWIFSWLQVFDGNDNENEKDNKNEKDNENENERLLFNDEKH